MNSITRFWEIEEISNDQHQMSPEDAQCEQYFIESHSRTTEGRYIVRLPFAPLAEGESRFGDSRQVALNRFHALDSRETFKFK